MTTDRATLDAWVLRLQGVRHGCIPVRQVGEILCAATSVIEGMEADLIDAVDTIAELRSEMAR
jgi:hypothetical protein